jgi:adenylate cyclase
MRSYAVAAAEQGQDALPGAQEVAVCFADLVGFTRLGQEIAPDELGRVAELLTLAALEVIEPPVRLVKTIGDAVMFVSSDARALVFAALDLIDALGSRAEQMPPLRAGIAMGPTMPRGGDWYGAPVNLASRITAAAKPGTVITDETMRRAAGTDGLLWKSLGAKRFRGLRGTHRVYHVRRQPANR